MRAIIIGVKMYVRDCRHDRILKDKKWAWRMFRVYDKTFDYMPWKKGSLRQYIQAARGK